ncbi:MAG: hypothetical protein AAF235_01870 [Planctomycetota bacterium]
MTTPTSESKTCVICGVDCAGRPRIKDSRGRYACQVCFDAKQAKSREHASRDDEHDDEHDAGPDAMGETVIDADALEDTAVDMAAEPIEPAVASSAGGGTAPRADDSGTMEASAFGTGLELGGSASFHSFDRPDADDSDGAALDEPEEDSERGAGEDGDVAVDMVAAGPAHEFLGRQYTNDDIWRLATRFTLGLAVVLGLCGILVIGCLFACGAIVIPVAVAVFGWSLYDAFRSKSFGWLVFGILPPIGLLYAGVITRETNLRRMAGVAVLGAIAGAAGYFGRVLLVTHTSFQPFV